MDSLYDEFGNYVGPELDESEEVSWARRPLEAARASRRRHSSLLARMVPSGPAKDAPQEDDEPLEEAEDADAAEAAANARLGLTTGAEEDMEVEDEAEPGMQVPHPLARPHGMPTQRLWAQPPAG